VSNKNFDFAANTELIANLFRISQAEGKLKCDTVDNCTNPEDLPTPEKSIAEIEKEQLAALKKKGSQLMLDE